MHRYVKSIVLSITIVISPIALGAAKDSDPPVVGIDELVVNSKLANATNTIRSYLSHSHYVRIPLDDDLSVKILERYLEMLDSQRMFFLRQDIREFEKHRYFLDDYIKKTIIDPAFAIFIVYRKRTEQYYNYAMELLTHDFNFDLDESFEFDRTEAQWAEDHDLLQELWRKRVKNDILNLRLNGLEVENIEETLRKRYRRRLVRIQQLNSEDVFQQFMNAYASSIEPHSAYFSPRASENFKIRMSLSLEGIGAVLQEENEYTLVRRVVKGGPADLSGNLHAGDRIVGVGQENGSLTDIIGWRLDDVVDQIRGPKGSMVRLSVLPNGVTPGSKTRTIEIIRNRIKLEDQAVQKSLIEIPNGSRNKKIGIIKVPTFYSDFDAKARGEVNYRSTTRDVRKMLDELSEEVISGLVVDLRDNGGGALDEAIELTGLFIDSGPIVQVKDYNGNIGINPDPDPEIAYGGPLAVLVNRNSASASEIFAGAIQDYQRGIVIGETTYGKGTVQNLIRINRHNPLGNDRIRQIKFTIAQFFRINGESTQHRGVIPDIVYPQVEGEEEHGERSLDNALPWSRIDPALYFPYEYTSSGNLLNALIERHKTRVRHDTGFRFLLERRKEQVLNLSKSRLSLNEKSRQIEHQEFDEKVLAGRNLLRESWGLPELEENSELSEEETEFIDNIHINEAANILVDYIDLLENDDEFSEQQLSSSLFPKRRYPAN